MYGKITEEMLQFIEKSPSAYHAVAQVEAMLQAQGFLRLEEKEAWRLEEGGRYYVVRNGSSLIAFQPVKNVEAGYRIVASHSDSPTFKIKENPEITVDEKYVKLNVECYGGMFMGAWMDRPLSVAGRVVIKEGDTLKARLVNVDRDLVMIPNLAIHMNREVNSGYKYNPQKDMLPLYGLAKDKDSFFAVIAQAAKVEKEEILAHDLYLYNRQKGSIWGAEEDFVSCGRLDDLQCAFGTLKGFLMGERREHTTVYCLFDNEEVGSGTRQGAASTFLQDVLLRINTGMGRSYEDYLRMIAQTYMISADNAHALHPNHSDMADPVNHPVINGGIVMKYSGNQKYCTDAFSAAMFKDLCRQVEVPYQIFVNRSDIPGGSTLGNIASARVPAAGVDIGLPQLAMHSPYETAGVKDTWYLVQVCEKFYG